MPHDLQTRIFDPLEYKQRVRLSSGWIYDCETAEPALFEAALAQGMIVFDVGSHPGVYRFSPPASWVCTDPSTRSSRRPEHGITSKPT
jgi:hypothetical protein